MNLQPFFDEYLRHAQIPKLELLFDPSEKTVQYRWQAEEMNFAMPISCGAVDNLRVVTPTATEWRTMPWAGAPEDFKVPLDLYYIDVSRETVHKPAA